MSRRTPLTLRRSSQVTLLLLVVAAVALIVAVIVTRPDSASEPDAVASNLVREDSPRLTGGGEVQLVEFLDFECEACVALYPYVDQLKSEYGDRIELVVRYMPLHTSSVNAALAAEAAGQQGAYLEMYDLLFQGSEEWGHQETPEREVFFGYAADLGLDMATFTADFEDPATLARVEQSRADGTAAGVTGTPTFFLDGQRLELTSIDSLRQAVEEALGE